MSEVHSMKSPDDKSIKGCPAAQHEHTKTILPIDNPKILAEKYNYEKLVFRLCIVGTGIIASYFW